MYCSPFVKLGLSWNYQEGRLVFGGLTRVKSLMVVLDTEHAKSLGLNPFLKSGMDEVAFVISFSLAIYAVGN